MQLTSNGKMTRFVEVWMLWITLVHFACDAKHVPLASKSRPRFLVIRPPPGSNQPNRVIVLTNPRLLKSEAEAAQANSSRADSPTVLPGLATLPESPIPTDVPADRVGGHPQSIARQKERPRGGTRSIRNLLEALTNQRKSRQEESNIARVANNVPRALRPVLPAENSFGDINIPRVIEAALKRARNQARRMGNVRPGMSGPAHDHGNGMQGEGSSMHHDFPGHSMHSSGNSHQFTTSNMLSPSDPQTPRNGKDTSSMTGSGLRSLIKGPDTRSGRRTGHLDMHSSMHDSTGIHADISGHTHNHLGQAVKAEGGLGGKTNSNNAKEAVLKSKNTIPKTNGVTNNGPKKTPVASKESLGLSIRDSNKAGAAIDKLSSPKSGSKSKPLATLSSNASVQIDTAQANSTSNTTETKTVKKKTIKVTTVVKGGTAADVAAAAASQAEIASAVSQGKEINATSIAEIAKAAVEKHAPKPHPKGSITIKRQNGVSVITLSDGIGEPVVIRAIGPVKIDRIVKPDGKIQFVVNPIIATKTTTPIATSAEKSEVESEEIIATTTVPYMFSSDIPFVTESTTIAPEFYPTMGSKLPPMATSGPKPNPNPVKPTAKSPKQDVIKSDNVPQANISPFGLFKSPRIPRPPPTIPRPPKVSDMMFGNRGLLDPISASLMPESGEMFPMFGPGPSTGAPLPPSDFGKHSQQPSQTSDIQPITSASDIMPQYDVVQNKSPQQFNVR